MPKGYKRSEICPGCKEKRLRIVQRYYDQPMSEQPIVHNDLCKKASLKYRLGWYKLTLREFVALLVRQNFKCAICPTELDYPDDPMLPNLKRMNIDHDHITGKVRGLLCRSCNMGLGSFKDNLSIVKSAVRYLEETA